MYLKSIQRILGAFGQGPANSLASTTVGLERALRAARKASYEAKRTANIQNADHRTLIASFVV